MIYWVTKNWRLFLDILLVVGLVVLFTFWDPFGLFTNAKTRTTANLVSSIKSIGQLVTAEYQGEVISSWKEYQLNEFDNDTLHLYAEEAFIGLKYDLDGIIENRTDRKKLATQLTSKDKLHPSFIAFLASQYFRIPLDDVYDKNKNLKSKWEERVLKLLIKELRAFKRDLSKRYPNSPDIISTLLTDYLNNTPVFLSDYYNSYQETITLEQSTRQNRRKKIVFIGRGTVKAGFDFGQLDESNFNYDRSDNTVHFYGIKPKVLDVDINPWFIPERRVKGFELVDYSGKVNFEDAKRVKTLCKQKLLAQAQKAEIIASAENNGQEVLRHLFSLLLDNPELKVAFHTHAFDHLHAAIVADSIITQGEALLIADVYRSNYDSLKKMDDGSSKERLSKHLKQFVNQIKRFPFENSGHSFNYYDMIAAQIFRDSAFVRSSDLAILRVVRGHLQISVDSISLITPTVEQHGIWFEDSDYINEYNEMLDWLYANADAVVGRYSAPWASIKSQMVDLIVDSTSFKSDSSSIRYYYQDSVTTYNYRLMDLVYPQDGRWVYHKEMKRLLADELKLIQISKEMTKQNEVGNSTVYLSSSVKQKIQRLLQTK